MKISDDGIFHCTLYDVLASTNESESMRCHRKLIDIQTYRPRKTVRFSLCIHIQTYTFIRFDIFGRAYANIAVFATVIGSNSD